jgi:hypothetical protein
VAKWDACRETAPDAHQSAGLCEHLCGTRNYPGSGAVDVAGWRDGTRAGTLGEAFDVAVTCPRGAPERSTLWVPWWVAHRQARRNVERSEGIPPTANGRTHKSCSPDFPGGYPERTTMNFFSTSGLRPRHGLLVGGLSGLLAAAVLAAMVASVIPAASPASAAVVAAAQSQVSDGQVPAVVISAVANSTGWDSDVIRYSAPYVYSIYDNNSAARGGSAADPARSLTGLRARVTMPAALVTAAQPELGASFVDQADNWSYLGTQIVGVDRVFDYVYIGTLVAGTDGPSKTVFGFPMTFGRQTGVTGSGSVNFVLTSTGQFTYRSSAIPGDPPDRCTFASSAVTCSTDLRIF